MNETRYPLCWPANWKRTANRTRAQFGKTSTRWDAASGHTVHAGKQQLSIAIALERLADELRRSGVNEDHVLVSTNVPTRIDGLPRSDRAEPKDPGVAVYWKRKGKDQCMAIDRYDRVADNIQAVAATLEALRAIERHGGGHILDRAFQGFAQLPAAIITQRPWKEVLQFSAGCDYSREVIEDRYRQLAQTKHPDKASGSHEEMSELNAARDAALAEVSS